MLVCVCVLGVCMKGGRGFSRQKGVSLRVCVWIEVVVVGGSGLQGAIGRLATAMAGCVRDSVSVLSL